MRRMVCDACWTISYEPTALAEDCELSHPHDGDSQHVRCGYCYLVEKLLFAQSEGRRLLAVNLYLREQLVALGEARGDVT